MIKVTCSRCQGKGTVAHRTAQHDARCFCCNGAGFYMRKPATKRITEADRIAAINATIVAKHPHLYDENGNRRELEERATA